MNHRSLLASFAHPDDETFGTGGTLAHYAAAGASVTLVCATRGEVGQISDPALATPETLAEVREAELRCAARALGIADPVFLGYRDSGMAGTPENGDPRAFANAPADRVVERLVGLIRRLRPQVVVTFDPEGGYGHPDHIAIHRHTVAAFHAAADTGSYPDQGAPWQPARLFYSAIPRSFFRRMHEQMTAMGVDTTPFARFADLGWPDDQIHVRLDVAGFIPAKWAALQCHRTQFGQEHPMRRLPEAVLHEMMEHEHFALAWPQPAPGTPLTDLFEGL